MQENDLVSVKAGDFSQTLQDVLSEVVSVDSLLSDADLVVWMPLGYLDTALRTNVAEIHHSQKVSRDEFCGQDRTNPVSQPEAALPRHLRDVASAVSPPNLILVQLRFAAVFRDVVVILGFEENQKEVPF